MDNIGEIIKEILEKRGIWHLVKQQEVLHKWPYITGEQIANNTEAVKIVKGVLWIKVKSSVWMHHLAMLKPEIMKKIHKNIKKDIVRDIYFFIGEISEEQKNEEPGKAEADTENKKSKFNEEEIKDMLRDVGDEEMRKRIRRIMEKE